MATHTDDQVAVDTQVDHHSPHMELRPSEVVVSHQVDSPREVKSDIFHQQISIKGLFFITLS